MLLKNGLAILDQAAAVITGGFVLCETKTTIDAHASAATLNISSDTVVQGSTGLSFNTVTKDASLAISGNPQFIGTGADGVGLRIYDAPEYNDGAISGHAHGTVKLTSGTCSGTKAAIEITGYGPTLKEWSYQDDTVRYVFLDMRKSRTRLS